MLFYSFFKTLVGKEVSIPWLTCAPNRSCSPPYL